MADVHLSTYHGPPDWGPHSSHPAQNKIGRVFHGVVFKRSNTGPRAWVDESPRGLELVPAVGTEIPLGRPVSVEVKKQSDGRFEVMEVKPPPRPPKAKKLVRPESPAAQTLGPAAAV